MRSAFDGRYGIAREPADLFDLYKIRELQFVGGCGFETRTTSVFRALANTEAEVSCTIVDLLNKNDPSYRKSRRLQKPNMTDFQEIAKGKDWHFNKITADLYSDRFVAHTSLLKTLREILRRFSGDFLVDISSLPRSIMLPALRVLWESRKVKNLFASYTEDPTVGHLEKQATGYRPPAFLPLFSQTNASRFSVWFPILGSDDEPLRKIFRSSKFNDTYPVVGFPSSRPIESDEIVRENQAVIRGQIEKIIFASMDNPFHLALKLNSMIDEIRRAFGNEANVILSPHGSKPQSVGVFLTSVMRDASVLYCQPLSYTSLPGKVGPSLVYWLKGNVYGS